MVYSIVNSLVPSSLTLVVMELVLFPLVSMLLTHLGLALLKPMVLFRMVFN